MAQAWKSDAALLLDSLRIACTVSLWFRGCLLPCCSVVLSGHKWWVGSTFACDSARSGKSGGCGGACAGPHGLDSWKPGDRNPAYVRAWQERTIPRHVRLSAFSAPLTSGSFLCARHRADNILYIVSWCFSALHAKTRCLCSVDQSVSQKVSGRAVYDVSLAGSAQAIQAQMD
ncbi:hypothetical protein VTG60DRAFT_4147 [Thermothelomyces hinnuleus]